MDPSRGGPAGNGVAADNDEVCLWLQKALDVQCREVVAVLQRCQSEILSDMRSRAPGSAATDLHSVSLPGGESKGAFELLQAHMVTPVPSECPPASPPARGYNPASPQGLRATSNQFLHVPLGQTAMHPLQKPQVLEIPGGIPPVDTECSHTDGDGKGSMEKSNDLWGKSEQTALAESDAETTTKDMMKEEATEVSSFKDSDKEAFESENCWKTEQDMTVTAGSSTNKVPWGGRRGSRASVRSSFNLPIGSGWQTFVANRQKMMKAISSKSTHSANKGEMYRRRKSRDFNQIVMKNEESDHKARNEISRLQRIVLSPRFELLFALVILANAIVMALEAQYNGLNLGYDQGFKDQEASDQVPWAEAVWLVAEWFFGLLFLIELTMKVTALKSIFFKDIWNVFDGLIVFAWIFDRVGEAELAIPPSVLRLTRLVRLLRLLRLVRTIQGFDSLYLMTASIRSSLSALGWSSAILFLGELMNALLMQVVLENYVKSDADPNDRYAIYERFGTCSKAMLTMFEMMFGNWYTVTRLLVVNVNEWFMVYGIAHQLFVGFAVLEVITGIFFHETFKVASMDDSIMMSQKNRQNKVHREKMDVLFHYADRDGSGALDREEFKAILGKAEIRTWLAAMDLDVSDVDTVFDLVANEEGALTSQELVDGVARLKGPARSIDVVALLKKVETLEKQMTKIGSQEQQRHQSELFHRVLPPLQVSPKAPSTSNLEASFKVADHYDEESRPLTGAAGGGVEV
mmetsp:Transcript_48757/g.115866  ORF Transcript_48757/g.115866 Transcript_48757/m.115866 type:complete len:746 (+) Transcript_48757:39-2276(+)